MSPTRQGLRGRQHQHRPARDARDGAREEGALRRAIRQAVDRERLALPHRHGRRSAALTRPPASATSGTSRRSSTRTRLASSCSRPRARSRGISSASTTARAICGSRCSTPPKTRSARRSTKALLYCYHYDLATGRYSLAIMRIVQAGRRRDGLSLGTLIFVWTRRERRQAELDVMFGIPAVSRKRFDHRRRRRRAVLLSRRRSRGSSAS